MREATITGLESIKEGKEIGWLCTSEPLGRYKTLYLSRGARRTEPPNAAVKVGRCPSDRLPSALEQLELSRELYASEVDGNSLSL